MKTGLKREEVVEILKKGKRKEKEGITVVFGKKKTGRCTVVISKKYIKKSVQRNTIKRYIRESIRKSEQTLPECVILFKKRSFDKKEVESLLQELVK